MAAVLLVFVGAAAEEEEVFLCELGLLLGLEVAGEPFVVAAAAAVVDVTGGLLAFAVAFAVDFAVTFTVTFAAALAPCELAAARVAVLTAVEVLAVALSAGRVALPTAVLLVVALPDVMPAAAAAAVFALVLPAGETVLPVAAVVVVVVAGGAFPITRVAFMDTFDEVCSACGCGGGGDVDTLLVVVTLAGACVFEVASVPSAAPPPTPLFNAFFE